MKHKMTLRHEFVEHIPNNLKDGTIYVSVIFATVAHKCCCGCGKEVVTPLSPTDWKLVFDGESISLDPSIGNWNVACRSHYWIIRNRVKWAKRWSPEEISAGRAYDSLAKERYFSATKTPAAHNTSASIGEPGDGKPNEGIWRKLIKWFRRK